MMVNFQFVNLPSGATRSYEVTHKIIQLGGVKVMIDSITVPTQFCRILSGLR